MTRKLMLLTGVLILFGSQSWAQKGAKISVADDPTMKEGNPGLVLVEVSDFQ